LVGVVAEAVVEVAVAGVHHGPHQEVHLVILLLQEVHLHQLEDQAAEADGSAEEAVEVVVAVAVVVDCSAGVEVAVVDHLHGAHLEAHQAIQHSHLDHLGLHQVIQLRQEDLQAIQLHQEDLQAIQLHLEDLLAIQLHLEDLLAIQQVQEERQVIQLHPSIQVALGEALQEQILQLEVPLLLLPKVQHQILEATGQSLCQQELVLVDLQIHLRLPQLFNLLPEQVL